MIDSLLTSTPQPSCTVPHYRDVMDAVLGQVQALAKSADEKSRKAILKALRDAAQAVETPDDNITRLWGGVCTLRASGAHCLFLPADSLNRI